MVALRVSHESLQFMMVFKAGSTFTFQTWFCEVEMYIFVNLQSQKDNYLHVHCAVRALRVFSVESLLRFVTLTLSWDKTESDMTVTLANKALIARLAKW